MPVGPWHHRLPNMQAIPMLALSIVAPNGSLAIPERTPKFTAAFGGHVSTDPVVRVIDLVHAWRRFPWIDPGLPAQFLPAPWAGTAAHALFARLHAGWADEARAEWKQLQDRA